MIAGVYDGKDYGGYMSSKSKKGGAGRSPAWSDTNIKIEEGRVTTRLWKEVLTEMSLPGWPFL